MGLGMAREVCRGCSGKRSLAQSWEGDLGRGGPTLKFPGVTRRCTGPQTHLGPAQGTQATSPTLGRRPSGHLPFTMTLG